MRPRVDDMRVIATAPLRSTLEALNHTGAGIAFLTDEAQILRGILTDGDIRRALLAGASLDTPSGQVMRRDFVALPVDTPNEQVLAALTERIRVIPLLDQAGRVVDYSSLDHIHAVPLMQPQLSGNELRYVIECIRTNWVSSQGRFVEEFETAFRSTLGTGPALSVMNGTAALHLALVTLGIGPGDEVLVPDLTFAASANAVIYTGAKPVLVDVTKDTWTMDPEAAEAAVTPQSRAIMPVHLYGHPADMAALGEVAQRHGLLVIEDAAEAIGARYKGQAVGSFGDAACFSFFGNKVITSGEGGMVVFRERRHWERARMLRDHGMSRTQRYWHDEVGFNYRMTNLQAAVGLAQLERLDEILERKRQVARAYGLALADVPWLQRPPCAPWADNIYWLYTVLLDAAAPVTRDEVLEKLLNAGIESRRVFFPLHGMPPYRVEDGRPFPNATTLSARGISLPSATHLAESDVLRVVEALKRMHEVKLLLDGGAA